MGQTGTPGRGKRGKYVATLLAFEPDFTVRGRILMGRFVKFDTLAASITDGLQKCDLVLA